MTGFVSIIDPPGNDPAPVPVPVSADGWFPDIDLSTMRAEMRIDATVTDARLRMAVRGAIVTVMNDLVAWQGDQMFAGHGNMEAVPAPEIDGLSRLVIAWNRAVYATAKAELIEHYRDFDTTAAGDKKVDALDSAISELRRDANHAVRDILGKRRTTVELI